MTPTIPTPPLEHAELTVLRWLVLAPRRGDESAPGLSHSLTALARRRLWRLGYVSVLHPADGRGRESYHATGAGLGIVREMDTGKAA